MKTETEARERLKDCLWCRKMRIECGVEQRLVDIIDAKIAELKWFLDESDEGQRFRGVV